MDDASEQTKKMSECIDVNRASPEQLSELLHQSVASPPADVSKFLDAWLRRLLQLSSSVEPEEFILLLIRAASAYYLDGRSVGSALAPISLAVRLAEERAQTVLLRRALSVQGLIYAASRKTPEALLSVTRAMRLAEGLEDHAAVAAAWVNLGVALFDASLYTEARVCYERADTISDVLIDTVLKEKTRAFALNGVALCCLWLGDFQAGVDAAEIAGSQLKDVRTREQEQALAVIETTRTHLLLALDRVDEAELHAGLACGLAEKCGSQRARVSAAMVSAILEVHRGRIDVGVALLESIVEEAAALPGTHLELIRVSIDVYERAGRPDAALSRLHELMRLNRQGAADLLSVPDCRIATAFGPSVDGLSTYLFTAKRAAELEGALSDRLTSVLNAAITTGLRAGHDHYRVFRLGKLARCFGVALGWSRARVDELALAVSLSDLGMIVLPEAILQKPRTLSPSERKLVEDHTRIGPDLLAQTQLEALQPCLAVARFHHERWDGSGPWSLLGEATPIEARVASLCDVLDALTHCRPWRPAMSLSTALREIERQIGKRFDPMLTPTFIAFIRETFWRVDDFEQFLNTEAMNNAYVRTRQQIAAMVQRGTAT